MISGFILVDAFQGRMLVFLVASGCCSSSLVDGKVLWVVLLPERMPSVDQLPLAKSFAVDVHTGKDPFGRLFEKVDSISVQVEFKDR